MVHLFCLLMAILLNAKLSSASEVDCTVSCGRPNWSLETGDTKLNLHTYKVERIMIYGPFGGFVSVDGRSDNWR